MVWVWSILGALLLWVIIYALAKAVGKFNNFILYGTTRLEKEP